MKLEMELANPISHLHFSFLMFCSQSCFSLLLALAVSQIDKFSIKKKKTHHVRQVMRCASPSWNLNPGPDWDSDFS